MTRQYFGTDGIRGRVGQSPITPDFVLRLAHAVGRVLKASEAHPVVLIGKDTRISGYMLESALESGFNSAGVDVVLLGPVPTPAVAFYKIFGLAKLFPGSKKFGKYHLTYLSKDENHPVDVLSGAYMLLRKETLDKMRRLNVFGTGAID